MAQSKTNTAACQYPEKKTWKQRRYVDRSFNHIEAKPFVKWVGGKRSVLNELLYRVPKKFTSYNECFVGGGALFFALKPRKANLSDINPHLMQSYQALRDNVESVIAELKRHKKLHNKSHFLKIRKLLSSEIDAVKLAAHLIYLNKTCYNGLYRVNKAGEFNAPLGSYENPSILDEENLRKVSETLQGVAIKEASFENIKVQKNAFYYLDPPYHQAYNSYSAWRFDEEEHEKLAEKCHEIDNNGGYFLLSNSNTDFVRDIYRDFITDEIMAGRYVSCKSNQRGRQRELLIRNYD